MVSAYAEFAIPLLADKPFIESLNLQVAGRYEDFSDVGSIFKPKFALAWTVNENALIRGAYSGGFKAPGLPQTTAVNVARSNHRYVCRKSFHSDIQYLRQNLHHRRVN